MARTGYELESTPQSTPNIRIDSIEMSEAFNDQKFWQKIKRYAKVAGYSVLRPALRLYFASRDKDTPTWAKRTIFAALAYFILPLDALPDFVPVVGYSDDLTILAAALTTVAIHIKDEHQQEAEAVLARWFATNAHDKPS